MMTLEELAALACDALDDDDARVVLADAIEETGWARYNEDRARALMGDDAEEEDFVRAVVAVLLAGDWPTSWLLADLCQPDLEDRIRTAGRRAGVRVDAMMRDEDGSVRVLTIVREEEPHGPGEVSQVYDALRAVLPRSANLRLDYRIVTAEEDQ